MFSDRIVGLIRPALSFAINRPTALRLLATGLVMTHIAWIALHAGLVYNERLNPWMLGGYAMYTVPPDFPRVQVLEKGKGGWAPPEGEAFKVYAFGEANYHNIFYCAAPPETALRAFFDDNPHARQRPLRIALSRQIMTRYPLKVDHEAFAFLDITWKSTNTVVWKHEACDGIHQGRFVYDAPY